MFLKKNKIEEIDYHDIDLDNIKIVEIIKGFLLDNG